MKPGGQLDDAIRAVTNLERESSASNVDRVVRGAESIEATLGKLDRAKDNDRTALEIARNWPRCASALRETLRVLRELEQSQFLADKGPDRCKDAETALRQLIDGYLRDQRCPVASPESSVRRKSGARSELGDAAVVAHDPEPGRRDRVRVTVP
jgi:hypothetical protein